MAADLPLTNTEQAWGSRLTQLINAGVKPKQLKVLKPIVKSDIASVKQGGQGMSNDEALLSSVAAIKGQTVLKRNNESSSLLDLPGNAVKDIGSITSGAIPGLARFTWNLPQEVKETAHVFASGTSAADQRWLKKHGYEKNNADLFDPSAWATALRNIAKTPILGLSPGFHTAANLTTAAGREDILKHPVNTALDVLPLADAAVKTAALGGALGDVAEEGSAAEAAVKGHAVKTAYRGLIPEGARGVIGEKTTAVLDRMGVGPVARDLARNYAIANRKAGAQFKDWLGGEGSIHEAIAKLPSDEIDQLYGEASKFKAGETADIPAEHMAILNKAERIGQGLAEVDPRLTRIEYNGDTYIYPNGKVAQLHGALGRASESLGRVTEKAQPIIEARTAAVTERLNGKLSTAQEQLARDTNRMEAVRSRITAQQEKATRLNRSVPKLQRELDLFDRKAAVVKTRQTAIDDIQGQLQNVTQHRTIQPHLNRIARAQERLSGTKSAFEEEFAKTPPASFEPMLKELARQKGMEAINVKFADQPEMLQAAQKQVLDRGDYRGYLDSKELNDIRNNVNSSWQELQQAGHTPIWIHNVSPGQVDVALSTRPLTTSESKVSQVRERVFDQSPRVTDIGVALSAAEAELLKAMQTREFIKSNLLQDDSGIINPQKARTWDQIAPELHAEVDLIKAKGQIPRGVDEQGALEMALQKRFREFDPNGLFPSRTPRLSANATVGDKLYLPKETLKAAEDLTKPLSQNLLAKGLRKGTAAYKYAIMALSLKHVAHVLFGGTAFLMGRGGVDEILKATDAWNMVKRGEMPVELSHDLDVYSADQLQQVATGGTVGRMWNDMGPGKAVQQIYKMESFITNVQRTLAYLGEESRALKSGMDPELARETGLNHAYRTLVDLDGMAPVERSMVRTVFPFYSFMRHTLQYVLTYPIDYPLRAAILSRINDIEQKDWSSGLPTQFQTLFFMGSPDATGDVTGVEMKQFNPFRDTGSYFTWAGFLQSLTPAIGIPISAAGINKFTGSPDLYPEVTVDPKTGNLVAKRPPNGLFSAVQSVVPETGLIDYFAGLTSDMRQLKARDPEAYKQRLWSMLFLPFEPKTVSTSAEAAHLQSNILRVAQQDVSDALKNGDTSKLNGYKVVPYNGELVPAVYLKKLIELFASHFPNTSPKATIPRNIKL